eukprot:gene28344-34220_t
MGGGASKSEGRKTQVKEGDRIPNVVLQIRVFKVDEKNCGCYEWKTLETDELFKGKRVVIFSVPGAFTPVCSCDHLPGYEQHYDEIIGLGIQEVYCISVNDAFVMRQWGISQNLTEEKEDNSNPLNPGNFRRVKLVPDGAAAFTRSMGMTVRWDKVGGFGERSWRYSAVFNDCKVEKLFLEVEGNIEDDSPHGPEPLMVSDAKSILKYLTETFETVGKNVHKQTETNTTATAMVM